MSKVILSIIVPVYNIEAYIQTCVDSILRQINDNIELILVDDGSKDNSPMLLDTYISSNVKVIHKENGGIVSARWAGINESQGIYIAFVDGDDWLEENCIESVFSILKEYPDLDMLCFGYSDVTEGGKKSHPCTFEPGYYNKERINEKIIPRALCNSRGEYFPCSIWGKIIKKSIVEQSFADDFRISIGEDCISTPVCIVNSKDIYMLDQYLYCYRHNPSSITRSKKAFDPKGPLYRKQFLQKKLADNEEFFSQIDRETVVAVYTMLKSQYNAGLSVKETGEKIKTILREPEYIKSIDRAQFRFFTKEKIKQLIIKHQALMLLRLL